MVIHQQRDQPEHQVAPQPAFVEPTNIELIYTLCSIPRPSHSVVSVESLNEASSIPIQDAQACDLAYNMVSSVHGSTPSVGDANPNIRRGKY